MSDRKSQRREFWVVLTVVFLGFVGISMPYLIFPSLFLNPAYSIFSSGWTESSRAFLLGVTLAAYPLGQFIGSPILGSLSDEFGRKGLLSGSLAVTAFCNLLTAFAIESQSLGLLIGSRLAAGLMEGNIAIARAMAADLKTISKHETFGKINAVSSIAFLVGPILGGLLTDKSLSEELTLSSPFYLASVVFLFLSALSLFMLRKSTAARIEKRGIWQRMNLIQRASALFSNPKLKVLLIASTLFTLGVDIFYQFGPVHLTLKWTLRPAQLILYNAVLCCGLALGNGWIPARFSKGRSTRLPILYSMGAFSLCLIGIVGIDSRYLIMALFGFCGLAIGLAVTLVTVRISDSVSDAIQGEVMGTQISLRVLGDGIMCLFGGALLALSPKLILIAAAALSFAAMIYYKSRQNE